MRLMMNILKKKKKPLSEEEIYVRYYTFQLLTTLLTHSQNRLQEAILTIPHGITRLMDMLMDCEGLYRVKMKAAKGKGIVKDKKEVLKPVDDKRVGKRKAATKAENSRTKPTKKKKLASKDPYKPNRPPSAFFVFMLGKLGEKSGSPFLMRRKLHIMLKPPKGNLNMKKSWTILNF